jgi:DNA (cytosine-5)-methyltransferase 1
VTKPPYQVPTMEQIRAMEPNGFNVASLFAGTGGSSTGYRMAGYRVVYANEFIPLARQCYALNAAPHTIIDPRDIRQIDPADVLAAIKLPAGALDILDGSPPCASYSTAGARAKLWGKAKAYSGVQQRTDDLFPHFARLLRGIRPRVFVCENVAGMVRGVAKGVFLEVLAELKSAGYRVAAKLLDASWLGVPQARVRLIIVGVRDDIGVEPAHPKPLPYQYVLRDALPHLAGVGTSKGVVAADQPCPTILTHGNRFTQSERTAVEAECDISRFAIGREWDRMGKPGTQSSKYFQLVRPALDAPCPTVTAEAGNPGAAGVCHPTQRRKFSIAELKAVCGFPPDFKLVGTYSQQWERLGRAVPPIMMSHVAATIRDSVLRRAA